MIVYSVVRVAAAVWPLNYTTHRNIIIYFNVILGRRRRRRQRIYIIQYVRK